MATAATSATTVVLPPATPPAPAGEATTLHQPVQAGPTGVTRPASPPTTAATQETLSPLVYAGLAVLVLAAIALLVNTHRRRPPPEQPEPDRRPLQPSNRTRW